MVSYSRRLVALMGTTCLGVAAMTGTAAAVEVIDLLAGQTLNVGEVTITNTDSTLMILLQTDSPWKMSEIQIDVACDPGDFPLTRTGNPKVGQFEINEMFVPAVDSQLFSLAVPSACGSVGDEVLVAVHAVVFDVTDTDTLMVLSGVRDDYLSTPDEIEVVTEVTRSRKGGTCDTEFVDFAPGAQAVKASEVWDQDLSPNLPAMGADWIWMTKFTDQDPSDPVCGNVVTFERFFQVPGLPVDGSLQITCVNGYEAFVNGTSVGRAQVTDPLGGIWQSSDLTQAFVGTDGWQSVESWLVGVSLLPGGNLLVVDGGNEEFSASGLDHTADGTRRSNPAGCIFKLNTSFTDTEETAWALGTDFGGRSWAEYTSVILVGGGDQIIDCGLPIHINHPDCVLPDDPDPVF